MDNLMTERDIASDYFSRLRQYNRAQKVNILLVVLKNELDQVLDIIQHYTSAIIILKLHNLSSINRIISNDVFVFNYNKTVAFENLLDLSKNPVQHKIEQYDSSIHLCLFLQINSTNQNNDIAMQQIIKRVKNNLFVLGFYKLLEGKYFIILSDNVKRKDLLRTNPQHIAVLIRGGYGDMVMILSILQTFVNKSKVRVDVITSIDRIYKFFSCYLKGCNVIFLGLPSEDTVFKFINSCFLDVGFYKYVYSITPNVIPNIEQCLHITDIWKSALNINEERFLEENSVPDYTIPNYILNKIRKKKNAGSLCVGIQLYDKNKEYKSWPKSHMLEFIDMCKDKKIFLVNLVPNTVDIPLKVFDVSFLDFNNLFGLIKHLDIVVGIDGCCGHIAGVLKVPNITIWGYDFPHCVKTRPISFRTISMNYSIVSEDGLASSIKPEIVFKRLLDFKNKNILMKESLITIDDTLAGENIEYIKVDSYSAL